MKKEKLIENIVDQVKEAQIKLGYVKETMRLYYPVSSLNALLGTNAAHEKEMLSVLKENFREEGIPGPLEFDVCKGKIQVCVLPQGVEYVHNQVETPAFLEALIHLFYELLQRG